MIIYRLISVNTVEDKIYRWQVFKDSLSKATIEDGSDNMTRYFDEGEYKDLLKYEGRNHCHTISIIKKKHKTGLKKVAANDLSYLKLPETPTNKEHS